MNLKKCTCVIAVSLLLATGCGNTKKLECSKKNDSDENISINQSVKAIFKNDSLDKVSINMDVELGEAFEGHEDEIADSVPSQFEDYNDKKGFKYSTSKRDGGFTFKLDVNLTEVDEDVKNKIDFVNVSNSYDQMRHEFENNGYTCK